MRRSASRESEFGSTLALPRRITRGCDARDPDRAAAQLEHDALVLQQDRRGRGRARFDARACGSREIAMSWLPSTANAGSGSRPTSSRRRGSPRGCVSRSPVIATRSGFRSAVQSTARSTACAPRDGTPRWKSERCAMRRPSSSGGSPAQLELELAQPHPAGLEPAPAEARRPRRPEKRSGAAPEGCRAGIHPTTHEMPQRRQTCAPLRLRASRAPAADRRCAA